MTDKVDALKAGIVDDIIDYENGQLDEPETLALFQTLVDSGMAWSLQGHYGRTALALLEAGLIDGRPEAFRE